MWRTTKQILLVLFVEQNGEKQEQLSDDLKAELHIQYIHQRRSKQAQFLLRLVFLLSLWWLFLLWIDRDTGAALV